MNIEKYLNELKAQKRSPKTIESYKLVLGKLDKFKNIDSIAKDDIVRFFNKFEGAQASFALYQVIIKKYFNDIGKPENVSWISVIKPKEKIKSDDILTSDDINKLIEATESHYWKALIAFLFETGCRIGEAKLLKYKDFVKTDHGVIVNIPTTKTSAGYRKMILPLSGQYILNLETYTNSDKDNTVFITCYSNIWDTLNEIAKKAGINKAVSPHKFRHAQATDLVKRGYNEAIIRKKLGWSATSGMIARYQHLNDEDVINATLENSGKLPQSKSPRVDMKEADKITLVEASMQFSKLVEENESLKEILQNHSDEIMTLKGEHQRDLQAMENEILETKRLMVNYFKMNKK